MGKRKSGVREPIKRDGGEGTAGARTFLCLKGGGEHEGELDRIKLGQSQ